MESCLVLAVIALAVCTTFGYELTTSHYYEYPSCKPECLQNRGGCPNNVPCHQKLDSVYRIEATGDCYLSLSTCWGCLKDEGVVGVGTHLEQVTCPTIPTAEPSAPYYEYPSCKPDCLQNKGGCPNGEPCHQIIDSVYLIETTGNCYKALSHCYGCLMNNGVSDGSLGTHLEHVMCPSTATSEPIPELLGCSAISSSDACMLEPECLWLPFTNPPRCGSMDKCEDNCEECAVQDCASGADGNCEWNSNIEQCVGAICENNCGECGIIDCDSSFAPPMGCMMDMDENSAGFQENCMKWEPTPDSCADIDSDTACSDTNGCWWMPFTSPPRCGSLDKCEDNCEACAVQECSSGLDGNGACEWNSYSEQCEGIECDTNCDECDTIPNRGTDYCNDSAFGCQVTSNNELCLQQDSHY